LELKADVERFEGAWLYYADAWHRGWRAFLHGKEIEVFKANLGFKAILLPAGTHPVKFVFFDGWRGIASYLIAVIGILFALSLLWVTLGKLLPLKIPRSLKSLM